MSTIAAEPQGMYQVRPKPWLPFIKKERVKEESNSATIDSINNTSRLQLGLITSVSTQTFTEAEETYNFKKKIEDFYSGFSVDLTEHKFNRDELHERD